MERLPEQQGIPFSRMAINTDLPVPSSHHRASFSADLHPEDQPAPMITQRRPSGQAPHIFYPLRCCCEILRQRICHKNGEFGPIF